MKAYQRQPATRGSICYKIYYMYQFTQTIQIVYEDRGREPAQHSSPVEAVHRLRTVAVDHEGHGLGRMVEYIGELLLFLLRKAAQHPIRQIPPGVGFCANPSFIRGKVSFPLKYMIFFMPLCPPSLPFMRMRIRPTGREMSSNRTITFSAGAYKTAWLPVRSARRGS